MSYEVLLVLTPLVLSGTTRGNGSDIHSPVLAHDEKHHRMFGAILSVR